jgi:hypothetical protein
MLDLAADRYSLLGRAESDALLSIGSTAGPRSLIEAFCDRGLVREGEGQHQPVHATPLRTSALEALARDGRLPAMEVAAARLEAALSLRVSGLGATMLRWRRLRDAYARKLPALSADQIGEAAGKFARGYARARIFVPAPRLCVPDSLALIRCLWRRGIDADLFFGVRLSPFAAHCWVQKDDLLLTDPLNIVADYTPVFRL